MKPIIRPFYALSSRILTIGRLLTPCSLASPPIGKGSSPMLTLIHATNCESVSCDRHAAAGTAGSGERGYGDLKDDIGPHCDSSQSFQDNFLAESPVVRPEDSHSPSSFKRASYPLASMTCMA